MPTIALVDDDRNILASLGLLLENQGYRVVTYTDGVSALEGFGKTSPDLAILDIKMPRMDGLELLRRLRSTSELPVIFLTSRDEDIDEEIGLKMGADDFVRKPFSQNLLVERIKVVLRRSVAREAPPSTATIERGMLSIDEERHMCWWKGSPVQLTVTEFLIVQALVMRAGMVRTRANLISSAFQSDEGGDVRTIDSHVKRLRRKFKAVDDGFDMVETHYGVGYRWRD